MSYTLRLSLFILLLFSVFRHTVSAQNLEEWKAYTSVRTVNDLAVDEQQNIWGATNGGIVSVSTTEGTSILTTIEGLSRLDGTSAIYDGETKQLFIGYVDGSIDVLGSDGMEIQALMDIERNDTYASKQINDFLIHGRRLYVATDFGIVVYNLDELYVVDSFLQIGTASRGNPVNDIYVSNDTLYAATPEGIGIGALADPLSINTNWSSFDDTNAPFTEPVMTVGATNGLLFASTSGSNYTYRNGNWNVEGSINSGVVMEYQSNDNGDLYAATESTLYTIEQGVFNPIYGGQESILSFTVRLDFAYLGTANNGIGKLDLQNNELEWMNTSGPFQNLFKDLKFDGNTLISSSTNKSSGNSAIDISKGYYIYDGEEWRNYNRRTNPILSGFQYQQAFTTTITEEFYYFGSWGRGVARHHKSTNEVHVFDETNSTLRGYTDDDPNFPVISGLETDSNDDVWIVSRFADTPLYYQSPGDEDWIPIPKANSVSGLDQYLGLFVDSFDQKWISLQSVNVAGTGLLVLNTGGDPANTSDDSSVKLTADLNNGNLPDEQVNAIIQDKEDEVWIGTGRGIAKFIFPELIINGGAGERQAQWLINEDTTATSRFLLRDVNVSSMAVNAANQKWIGSVNQGVWLLNAEGSKILRRFTAENSPLFSNNINSIAINDETGEVFIATESGLISFMDVPKAPVSEMNTLKVYPNPFTYKNHEQIVVEGLSEETTLKVMGVDGTVVNELIARGGRVSWNGLDYNGNQLGSGIYFVIAFEDGNNQTGIGKVAIIR